MSTKSAKEVVLGVTGSIAAYKAAEVASLLVKQGVRVTASLTRSAQELIGPATFEGITGNRAITAMFDSAQNAEIDHIAVSTRADLFVVAPATANILGKAAHGVADDWLSTALLVTQAPILFAPAMNTNMYEHPAVQENIAVLESRGCQFIGPDVGVLACKTVGPGRLIEPRCIVDAALAILHTARDLEGKRVLITSGANHEPIDPVRYIGNRSSGKMGRALALEALQRGATVTVIAGPSDVAPPANAEIVHVQTAQEMFDAVTQRLAEADIVIGAAAVADYRVKDVSSSKRKRNGNAISLDLVENPDIIAAAGASKRDGQIVIGFAVETDDLVANAQRKLTEKNLDLIVANEIGTADSDFGTETISAQFIDASGGIEEQPLLEKRALAAKLFDRIAALTH